MGMRVVINQLEIFVFKREDVFDFRIDQHFRQRPGVAGELKPDLLQVV